MNSSLFRSTPSSNLSTTWSDNLEGLLLPVLSGTCCNDTVLSDGHFESHNSSSIEISVLLLQGTKKHLLETCLAISSVSLLASLFVYCALPELRTVPGKCLMGLIVSELVTDLLVIAALQYRPYTLPCFIIGILLHYFFLTIVCWTSVIGESSLPSSL